MCFHAALSVLPTLPNPPCPQVCFLRLSLHCSPANRFIFLDPYICINIFMIYFTLYNRLWEGNVAPHSSTLAWKIPWMEEPGGLQYMASLRVGHDWATSLSFSLSCIGEGNGNPLQCSCLENPRDGGAWWAAVYGGAQSWTRLGDLAAAAAAAYNRL